MLDSINFLHVTARSSLLEPFWLAAAGGIILKPRPTLDIWLTIYYLLCPVCQTSGTSCLPVRLTVLACIGLEPSLPLAENVFPHVLFVRRLEPRC